jgi:hypothetical protein
MYSEQARAYSPTEANPMTAHLELHEVANGTPRGIKMNSARGFGTGAAAARGGGDGRREYALTPRGAMSARGSAAAPPPRPFGTVRLPRPPAAPKGGRAGPARSARAYGDGVYQRGRGGAVAAVQPPASAAASTAASQQADAEDAGGAVSPPFEPDGRESVASSAERGGGLLGTTAGGLSFAETEVTDIAAHAREALQDEHERTQVRPRR